MRNVEFPGFYQAALAALTRKQWVTVLGRVWRVLWCQPFQEHKGTYIVRRSCYHQVPPVLSATGLCAVRGSCPPNVLPPLSNDNKLTLGALFDEGPLPTVCFTVCITFAFMLQDQFDVCRGFVRGKEWRRAAMRR